MKSTTKSTSTRSPAPATPRSTAPALAPKTTRVPQVKPVAPAPKPAPTIITAKIDVGFGNSIYLRGIGPGLSWNKGVALTCVAGSTWTITLSGVEQPVTFKFLVNDETWSRGEDYLAAPGSRTECVPEF